MMHLRMYPIRLKQCPDLVQGHALFGKHSLGKHLFCLIVEEILLRPGAKERGDLLASSFDSGAGLLAEGMDGGGIAELRGEIGEHGV